MLLSSFRPLVALCAQVTLCFGAVFCAPGVQAADGQTLYNFVKPMDVVQVVTRDASLPSLTAEVSSEGEILRRLNFNQAAQPSLRLTPQSGSWDWSTAGAMSLRVQNAMDWALTLEVQIESADGKVLRSSIALPAGPAQTLLVP
ncbi:MAG: beta-agarase, partial [Pseudomonas sp.]|nr:beta-agarase [Pseudomonas sp.]